MSILTACVFNNKHDLKDSGAYYKVGNPYQIKGIWYYPKEDDAYDETGVASWYGPEFHGKETANGDEFNENSLTAAHRTLPLPSMVRVTNLDNNKSMVLMVNDRGPFSKSRIIDVSKRASEILGFKNHGTAKVRVQYLPDQTDKLLASLPGGHPKKDEKISQTYQTAAADSGDLQPKLTEAEDNPVQKIELRPLAYNSKDLLTSPISAKKLTHYVQAGTFGNKANAENLVEKLRQAGDVTIEQIELNNQSLYRVRIGPLTDREKAQHVLQAVMQLGHNNAIVVTD